MLKVEDDELPAHRAFLSESSDVFKSMFQARSFNLSMLSCKLNLELHATDTALCQCTLAIRYHLLNRDHNKVTIMVPYDITLLLDLEA